MPTHHRRAAPITACRCAPSEIEAFARAARRRSSASPASAGAAAPAPADASWIAAVAKDLQAHRGTSLVIAGDGQPPAVHALAHAMNAGARQRRHDRRLHRAGRGASRSISSQSLRELVADMNAGTVDAARHPRRQPGLHRARRSRVRRRARARCRSASTSACTTTRRRRCATGTSPRRTSSKRGATRARYDGTASIVQPLIAPLYGGKSAHELLAALSDRPERSRLRHRPRLLAAASSRRRRLRDRRGGAGCTTASIAGHGVRAEDGRR